MALFNYLFNQLIQNKHSRPRELFVTTNYRTHTYCMASSCQPFFRLDGASDLELHIRGQHTNSGMRCGGCRVIFHSSNEKLLHHYKKHVNQHIQCKQCNLSTMVSWDNTRKDDGVGCRRCGRVYFGMTWLEYHPCLCNIVIPQPIDEVIVIDDVVQNNVDSGVLVDEEETNQENNVNEGRRTPVDENRIEVEERDDWWESDTAPSSRMPSPVAPSSPTTHRPQRTIKRRRCCSQ